MYFNHAFRKLFLGTGTYQKSASGTTASQLTGSVGVLGNFGLYNAQTFVNLNGATGTPFILAASSLTPANDKIGPFHGGYAESNKSKVINPKYISAFNRIDPKAASASVIHIGQTEITEAAPYNCACPTFNCDATYYLRIDVKGSPALRFLNHNVYKTLSYYTGCCDGTSPAAVDPGFVMAGWATQITGVPSNNYADADPILSPFIQPIVAVYDPGAATWSYYTKDGEDAVVNGETFVSAGTFASYVTPEGVDVVDVCAGLILAGAYVDTVFGDCSFQPTDYFEKEPVLIFASEVDEVGNPCEFSGICVKRGIGTSDDPATAGTGPVLGKQGEGFGETVVRDMIQSEMYRQNYWNDDPRIREITLGDATLSSISRSGTYTRYQILHNVPRFNNPSSTFDNDQYLLEIIVDGTVATFEADMAAILTAAGNGVTLQVL
jgi:hypothetical protein